MPSDKLIKVTNNLRDEIARREKICEAYAALPPLPGLPPRHAMDDPNDAAREAMARFSRIVEQRTPVERAFEEAARTGYPEVLAALADAVAALEWYANRGSVEPRTISGRRAKDALAQIAGRLGHMDVGREGEG